jgi:hypothetical protein
LAKRSGFKDEDIQSAFNFPSLNVTKNLSPAELAQEELKRRRSQNK